VRLTAVGSVVEFMSPELRNGRETAARWSVAQARMSVIFIQPGDRVNASVDARESPNAASLI